MKPWTRIDECRTPDGALLGLWQRGDELSIRIEGQPLMGNRAQGSEIALAEKALGALGARARPQVLVGGLGFGYTLRAVLDRLPADGQVTVVELIPQVLRWHEGPLADCAGAPLGDPRVRVIEGDVAAVLRAAPKEAFDAVLLDVDNGPEPLTQRSNAWLYSHAGLVRIAKTLTGTGVLAVWSARADDAFTGQLRASGFEVTCHSVRARVGGKGERHVVWTARSLRRPRSGRG